MMKRIFNKIRRHTFPTIQDRWRAAKGDQTLRLDYPIDDKSLVLDFGGFEGEWATNISDRFGSSIIIFEPIPEFAKNLSNRFEKNPKIEICAYGLGSEDRTETIYLNSDGSSMFTKEGESITMQVANSTTWFNNRKIEKIALAKLNIEGAEYELLETLIRGDIIRKIEHIQIQFHEIAPDSRVRRKAIQESLSKTHELKWCYEFVWESWTLKNQ